MSGRHNLHKNRRASRAVRAAAFAVAAVWACGLLHAGPQGQQVVSGSASFQQSGNITKIYTSNNAVINYSSFNIAPQETVQFVQPNASSRVLNRISSVSPTYINGTLLANGQVYIINPAGVIFGQGSVINVGQLYAAAANMTNADFLGNVNHFTSASGAVVNYGQIAAQTVALVGQRVANYGSIVAPDGMVTMAAGADVILSSPGGHVVAKIEAAPAGTALPQTGVENAGTIQAKQVCLGAGDMYSIAIQNTGQIKADEVAIDGGTSGEVRVGGTIDVSNKQPGGKGGTVTVTGEQVALSGAAIDASGDSGGGTVLIGGGAGGNDPSLANARSTSVSADSTIAANAVNSGNGGTVVVWSDYATSFYGGISARALGASGNGGNAEISGKVNLAITGLADLRSAHGKAGTLLLDPGSVTIDHSDTDPGTTVNYDTFGDAWISNQLALGNLVIDTANSTNGNTPTLVSNPDSAISWSTLNSLTLTSGDAMTLNGTITSTGGGAVYLNAATTIAVNGEITAGDVSFTAPGGISLNVPSPTAAVSSTGSQTYNNDVALSSDTFLSSSGAITFNGAIDGANHALIMTSTGSTITVAGAITNLGALTLVQSTGASFQDVNAASLDIGAANTGTITFNTSFNLSGDLTVEAGNYSVSFLGTSVNVNGPTLTTFTNAGDLTLGSNGVNSGNISVLIFASGIDTTQVGGTVSIAAEMLTTNTPMTLGAITLNDDTGLGTTGGQGSSLAGGALTVGAVTGNNHQLEIYTNTAAATFNGPISNVTEIDLYGSNNVTFNSTVQTGNLYASSANTGSIIFNGDVTVSGALTTDAGYFSMQFPVNLTVSGPSVTTFNNFGGLLLGDGTGTKTLLFASGLDTSAVSSGGGPVQIGGTVSTFGSSMNLGAITLIGDTALTTSGGTLTGATVDGGGFNFTVDSGSGTLTFNSTVANIGAMTINASSTANFQALGATSLTLGSGNTGAINFNNQVSISGDLTVLPGTYSVNFLGTSVDVEGPDLTTFNNTGGLTLGTGGNSVSELIFASGINTTPVDAGGGVVQVGSVVYTTTTPLTLGAITLTATVGLGTRGTSSTGGGLLTVGGAITGNSNTLQIFTNTNDAVFNGAISGVTELDCFGSRNITFNAPVQLGTLYVAAANTGAVTFNSDLTVTSALYTDSGPCSVQLLGNTTVSGATPTVFLNTGGLTLGDSTGALTESFAAGLDTTAVGAGGGTVQVGGTVTTTASAMNLGTITLIGSTSLTSSGGSIATGAIAGGGQTLAMDSTSTGTPGDITVSGAASNLTSLSATGNNLSFSGVATSGNQTYTAVGTIGMGGTYTGYDISATTNLASPATVASLYDASGNLTITAVDNFTMTTNDKLTALGNLVLTAGNSVSIGDLNALSSISVTAPAINILTRGAGNIYLASGRLVSDNQVDFVAGGDITFSTTPTLVNSGPPPIFSNGTGNPIANLTQYPVFLTTSRDFSSGSTVLDMVPGILPATDLATALNGPSPAIAGVFELAPVSLSPDSIHQLDSLGIPVRAPSVQDILASLFGPSLVNDTQGQAAGGVSAQRLSAPIAAEFLAQYRSIFCPGPSENISGKYQGSVIKAAFQDALADYSKTHPGVFSIHKFVVYLRTTPAQRDVYAILQGLNRLLKTLELLGLGPAETDACAHKLLEPINAFADYDMFRKIIAAVPPTSTADGK